MTKTIKIEFVCTANHGRSPVAQAIAKDYVAKLGLSNNIEIFSSGSHESTKENEEDTKHMDYQKEEEHRTEILAEMGLTTDKQPEQTVAKDYHNKPDFIFAMTERNLNKVKEIYYNVINPPKMELLSADGIPDPFHGSLEDYKAARDAMMVAVKRIIDDVVEEFGLVTEKTTLKTQQNNIPNEKNAAKTLTGTCACPGEVEGRLTRYDPNRTYTKEDIVILNEHMTQDVLKLKNAGAILSRNGGLTCHASILARELNVPCLVGVRGMEELKEETKVKVDAADEKVVVDK